MSELSLYAIFAPGDAVAPQAAIDGARVVRHGGLAALVGEDGGGDLQALSREEAVRRLIDHQRIVEGVMGQGVVLPVKFGTTLPDEGAVVRVLAQAAPMFRPRLAALAGQVQIELAVTWPVQTVLGEIAAGDDVRRLKATIVARGEQATVDERVALGRFVKAALDGRRAAAAEVIRAAVAPLVADVVENALLDDRMVANLALLVPQAGIAALEQAVDRLDVVFGGLMTFRLVGPLPPYSFAMVEVARTSVAEIETARQALGLGLAADPDEIRAAYRQAAKQCHPDVGTAPGPDADARFACLTAAYRSLAAYAEARRGLAATDAVDAEGDFEPSAVERTMIVAVRRQDAAASGAGAAP